MSSYRIFITDDHEIMRAGLKSLIDKETMMKVVGEASHGEEMLSALKNTPCDLVGLDLFMPKMDGMVALKTLREKFSNLKILVLTMQKDSQHFKHAMTHGASGYVLKDDAFEQLVKAVTAIMKGHQFVSPSVAALAADRYIRSMDEVSTPSLSILTKREQQILKLIANGLANKNIASKLKISIRTVETHRANLTGKLGIKTTAGLVKYAISKDLTK